MKVFCLLAIIAVVFAQQEFIFGVTKLELIDPAANSVSGTDIWHFILGVVEGFGSELLPNMKDCLESSIDTMNDFIRAYNDLVANNPRQFALDCAEGLQAIYDAIDACGSTEDAIEETAELLSSGGLSIVYHAGVSLVLHGVDIYHWVKDCYENFEEKNWLDAGRDIGDIIGVLV